MKILALEKEIPGASGRIPPTLLKAEAARVWEIYKQGLVREIYFMENENRAVIIMEIGDASEARKILASLPLVQEGLIDFDIIPLIPYPGFGRLFAKTGRTKKNHV
jgi:muconolactone delta-isomerase